LLTHFQDVNFSACSVNVELGLFWLVSVDALAGQEVNDVVLAITVPVSGCHLRRDEQFVKTFALLNVEMLKLHASFTSTVCI
jgi:hypothetical protein